MARSHRNVQKHDLDNSTKGQPRKLGTNTKRQRRLTPPLKKIRISSLLIFCKCCIYTAIALLGKMRNVILCLPIMVCLTRLIAFCLTDTHNSIKGVLKLRIVVCRKCNFFQGQLEGFLKGRCSQRYFFWTSYGLC